MNIPTGLWPIAIVQDRYSGVYADAEWLAVAQSDFRLTGFLLCAHGDDGDAMEFWWGDGQQPAPCEVWWIGKGATPDAALADLLTHHAAKGGAV